MNSKYIILIAAMISAAALFCSCSSGSDGAVKVIAVAAFIVLFLGTSVCTAFITYKLKRKKNDSDTASSQKKEQ